MARIQPPFEELRLETPWPYAASSTGDALARLGALRTPIGHSGWSIVLGALGGALGGIAMLSLAQHLLTLQHHGLDLSELLSRSRALAAVELGSARQEAFIGAAGAGAALGALLGYLARRLVRIIPRVLFFGLLVPSLWTFAQACVMGMLAPGLARTLPFVPLVLGACAY